MTWMYGVFVWRGDGRYRAQEAIGGKLWKFERFARNRADFLNAGPGSFDRTDGHGYVVRQVPVDAPVAIGGGS